MDFKDLKITEGCFERDGYTYLVRHEGELVMQDKRYDHTAPDTAIAQEMVRRWNLVERLKELEAAEQLRETSGCLEGDRGPFAMPPLQDLIDLLDTL